MIDGRPACPHNKGLTGTPYEGTGSSNTGVTTHRDLGRKQFEGRQALEPVGDDKFKIEIISPSDAG